MIYLDTAALVKLVRREPESDALVDWLSAHADRPLVSSTLVEVELTRALRRTEPGLLGEIHLAIAGRMLLAVSGARGTCRLKFTRQVALVVGSSNDKSGVRLAGSGADQPLADRTAIVQRPS